MRGKSLTKKDLAVLSDLVLFEPGLHTVETAHYDKSHIWGTGKIAFARDYKLFLCTAKTANGTDGFTHIESCVMS